MRLLTRYAKALLLGSSLILAAGCASTGTNGSKASADEAAAASNSGLAEFDAATKLMRRRRYDEAETALLALSKSNPDLAGVWGNLGIVYVKTERPQLAIPALQRAVKLNPTLALAHNQLGVTYSESKQYRAAEKAYLDAIAADPSYAKAMLNLGILYDAQLQRPADAVSSYRNYLAAAPELSKPQQAKVLIWIKQAAAKLAKPEAAQ